MRAKQQSILLSGQIGLHLALILPVGVRRQHRFYNHEHQQQNSMPRASAEREDRSEPLGNRCDFTVHKRHLLNQSKLKEELLPGRMNA